MWRLQVYPAHALQDVRQKTFTSFLDFARWTAAGMVFVGHLRNPLFLGYGALDVGDQTLLVKLWFFVTGWYATAVIVFFVLSGFLVGGLNSAKASIRSFVPADYAIDRFTRIFVAFLPALLLTVFLDVLGSSVFSATGFYDHTHPMIREKVSSAPFIELMTPEVFFGNAALLQTYVVPPFGSNQPLWTISSEFWFYVVFGLLLSACIYKSLALRAISTLLTILIFIVLGARFPVFLGLWLIGVATAFVPWRILERPVTALLLFVLVLVFTRLWQDSFRGSFMLISIRNYIVAISFAWLLVSMRHVHSEIFERLGRFNRFMADFSYSLYLIHFPLMLFVLGALHWTGWFAQIAEGYRPTSGEGLLIYFGVILLVYLSAWVFSQVTERQTGKIRRMLKNRLTSAER